ncbi:9635_t:CDS:2 [Rhizophagus irregularis]|nr:9635_t:CDS:2 [Rhizophagus irregularis]
MSSELELSKQRITELEAENSGLRIKLSVSDAEIAELKHSNIESGANGNASQETIGSQRDQRPQVLDSITQPCNSASSEVSANSDGGEVPPK